MQSLQFYKLHSNVCHMESRLYIEQADLSLLNLLVFGMARLLS